MSDKIPDRVSINDKDKKEYDRLKEKDSPFKIFKNKEDKEVKGKNLFMIAMVIGYSQVGTPLKLDKKLGYAQLTSFTEDDISIIKSIAVAKEKSLDVLLDKNKVFSIAEEYANSGIKLLKDDVFSGDYGDYLIRLEEKLVSEYEKIGNLDEL